ncbi:MAG: glycosyltransferase family protein [Ferruginibacter sp.]
MKILYAVQATGNGHISRANEIIPLLEQMAEVDVLLSGTQASVSLNHLVKYRRKGLSFVFGKKGGIDFVETWKLLHTKKFLREIKSLPVEQYDLVLNDFEPLSAWACKLKNIPCFAISHQFAVTQPGAPRPAKLNPLAWMLLKYYAPCNDGIGFHFEQYCKEKQTIVTPVIRKEIRNAFHRNNGHYTVYLPAYSDQKLIKVLSKHTSVNWHIFSRNARENYSEKNCWVRPVNNYDFISSFTTCEGIICGAGFETPAEALYMGKKLLAIPMKSQYEQQCNAAALEKLGVKVISKLPRKKDDVIGQWIRNANRIQIDYPDLTKQLLMKLLDGFNKPIIREIHLPGSKKISLSFTEAFSEQ